MPGAGGETKKGNPTSGQPSPHLTLTLTLTQVRVARQGAARRRRARTRRARSWMAATLGVAMVAMGENLGAEMVTRCFYHMIQYADLPVGVRCRSASPPSPFQPRQRRRRRRALQDVARPDADVATSAIIGPGLSRRARTTRGWPPRCDRCHVLHQGAGAARRCAGAGADACRQGPRHPLAALSRPHRLPPGRSRCIVSPLHILLDFNSLVLGKHHFLLFVVACAIRPRMLVTVDEELKPLPVSVRPDRPPTPAGGPEDHHRLPDTYAGAARCGRAWELATDEYLPLTSILEGVVILKPNPDHIPTTLDDGKPTPSKKSPAKKDEKDLLSNVGRINKPLSHW